MKPYKNIKKFNKWGYSAIYTRSAILNIDRSYPEYFDAQGFSYFKIFFCKTISNNMVMELNSIKMKRTE